MDRAIPPVSCARGRIPHIEYKFLEPFRLHANQSSQRRKQEFSLTGGIPHTILTAAEHHDARGERHLVLGSAAKLNRLYFSE
jgi:hypothetical protein